MIFSNETNVIISDHIKSYLQSNRMNCIYIIVPVLSYKTIIPKVADSSLNFFQKIILKSFCYKSAVLNIDEKYISHNFNIDIKLVNYIISELESLGYYQNGFVTDKGKSALDGDIVDSNETVSGYFFYDLIGEKFWDIFIPENDLESMKIHSEQYNNFYKEILLSKGYKSKKAYIVEPNYDLQVPDNIEKEYIYQAFIEYCNNYHSDNVSMYDSSINEGNFSIDKIHVISEPTPYYAVSYIFYNDSRINTGFNVAHPFLEDIFNYEFNENVLEYSKSNSYLYRELDKRLKDLHLNYSKVNYDNIESLFVDASYFIKNKDHVLKIFGDTIFSYYELADSEKNDAQNKANAREAFIKDIYNSFEYITKDNIKGYFKYDNLSNKTDNNIKILDNIASNIGFDVFEDSNITFFYGINKNRIKRYENETELRHLCAISILEALENKDHYYYRLAEKHKEFFKELLTLKKLRDDASHSERIQKIDFSYIDKYIYYLIDIFEIIYNTKIDTSKIDSIYNERNIIKADFDDAKNYILMQIGNKIKNKKFDDLFDYLSKVKYDILSRHDIDISVTRVLESIIDLLIDDVGYSLVFDEVKLFLSERNENSCVFDLIIKSSKETGFSGIDKPLFLYFKLDFLIERWNSIKGYERLISRKKFVFTDKLIIYWIYCSLNKPNNFKLLSEKCPDFFVYMLKYCKREHNASLLYSISDANFNNDKELVLKDILLCANSVIDILI